MSLYNEEKSIKKSVTREKHVTLWRKRQESNLHAVADTRFPGETVTVPGTLPLLAAGEVTHTRSAAKDRQWAEQAKKESNLLLRDFTPDVHHYTSRPWMPVLGG